MKLESVLNGWKEGPEYWKEHLFKNAFFYKKNDNRQYGGGLSVIITILGFTFFFGEN
jgi:hypothetical protein